MPLIRAVPTLILACALLPRLAAGMDKPYPGPHIETDDLLIVLRQHAPEQIAAFYEARGFPPAAIELIKSTCFVTVHIENHSSDVIWLDTSKWTFTTDGKSLQRLDRPWWDAQWDRIDLRQASRSTFGWTQLPALRDLQPDEPVGGNIVFPGEVRHFDMAVHMPTGADRAGRPITHTFRNIECLKEVPGQ